MRARLQWPVVLAGFLLVVAVPGASLGAPARGFAAPVIVAFGDSIAAGEGSGADHGFPDNPAAYSAVLASRLGGSSYNFSITGACASAGTGAAPGTDSFECKVGKSIMTQQIPAARKLGPAAADVVDDHGRRQRHSLLGLLPRARLHAGRPAGRRASRTRAHRRS